MTHFDPSQASERRTGDPGEDEEQWHGATSAAGVGQGHVRSLRRAGVAPGGGAIARPPGRCQAGRVLPADSWHSAMAAVAPTAAERCRVKVLLIDPPEFFLRGDGHTRQVMPLGLGYLGAVLAQAGHAVRFLLPDVRARTAGDAWAMIRDVLRDEDPDLVGVTAVTATFPALVRLVAEARAVLGPRVPIVVGGVHATFCTQEAAQVPGVSVVVRGEGEYALRDLVDGYASVGGFDPVGVPGCAVWRDGALPMPLHGPLVWDDDIAPAFHQAMISVRGCPYRCIYCSVPNADDSRTRLRPVTDIVAEIQVLRARWRIPYLFFHDSVFTLHRKRTIALMEELVAQDLVVPFTCQTRADRIDDALVDALAAGGCRQIFFGIESGDPDTLVRIRKDVPLGVVESAVHTVQARGIRAAGFFMIGWPWDTPARISQSIDFATGIGLDAISLFSATPLPGTELWQMARERPIPAAIDFRGPGLNLTAMSDAQYARRFAQAAARVDAYNQGRMMAALGGETPLRWPGALPERATPAKPRP